MSLSPRSRDRIVWLATVLVSALIIWLGHAQVMDGLHIFPDDGNIVAQGRVLSVDDQYVDEYTLDDVTMVQNTTVLFTCKLLDGEHEGKTVSASQNIDELYSGDIRPVQKDDKIILYYNDYASAGEPQWIFTDYQRLDQIMVLAAFFILLVLLIGRRKGLNTLISLTFTCLFVFLVFVPSVLNGFNIYIFSVLTCAYTIVMTLLLISGVSRKTLATILGCLFGVLIAALISVYMDKLLMLTGFVDEHSIYLQMLDGTKPINLKAIIFGSIIIGAMGAVMDVAMDIASALYELKHNAPDMTFAKLYKSGMAIGRDIMGTMANTLILAYIGSSLASTLLLFTHLGSITELLNKEQVIVEIMQALIGSTAILLTIPLTVVICGLLYIQQTPTPSTEGLSAETPDVNQP